MRRRSTLALSVVVLLLALLTSLGYLWPRRGGIGTVGTAATHAGLTANFQRKTLYAQGYHWIFYSSGSHILYESSPDGLRWEKPTVLMDGISSSAISVWYDGKIHLAQAPGTAGLAVVYKRAALSGGTLMWEREEVAVPGIRGVIFNLTSQPTGFESLWEMSTTDPSMLTGTTTSIRTGASMAGAYLLFQPGLEVTGAYGISLPDKCTQRGWRSRSPLSTIIGEGVWKIGLRLINSEDEAHAGRPAVRLWRSPEADMSNATSITGWVEGAALSFAPQAGEAKRQTITVGLPDVALLGEYLFMELAWKTTVQGTSNLTGVVLASDEGGWVETPTYEYYNAYVSVADDGSPWVSYLRNDGFNWSAHVTMSRREPGSTWNASTRVSGLSPLVWRPSILPLDEGRMYALYASETGIKGRLWDGKAWAAEEEAISVNLTQDYGYSAVAEDGDLHLALLRDVSYDLLYLRRVWDIGWQAPVVLATGLDPVSFPGLSADELNGAIYVFWLHQGALYMKRAAKGEWDNSTSTPLGTGFDSPKALTVSYRVENGRVCVAWLEGYTMPFRIRYGSVSVHGP